ncbi:MAG: DUF2798 domain-containing protein [Halothiobacillaceae bacterium]
MKIPARFHDLVFALLMSMIMSFLMSAVITFTNLGLPNDFLERWLLEAFPGAWVVAFPIALFVVPAVRRLTGRLVERP